MIVKNFASTIPEHLQICRWKQNRLHTCATADVDSTNEGVRSGLYTRYMLQLMSETEPTTGVAACNFP